MVITVISNHMKKYYVLVLLTVFFVTANAQSEQEQSVELKAQAITLMDKGEIPEALSVLEKAKKIDPGNIDITYEIAFAFQLAHDYEKSIEIAKPLLKHPDVFDQVYQLLGNCYDLSGDKSKAIKYYDKGIKKFPNSGKLFLEKGIVLASMEKWDEALDLWEEGIIADPKHSSNYFYASQLLAQTDEKIWAIYYGEIFINLESNTSRTPKISKLLYDTYKACLPVKNNQWGLEFSRKATNIVFGNMNNLKFSFETVHNLAMEKAYKNVEPDFTVDNLIQIRKQFLEIWNKDYADKYPNLIFDYHNTLIQFNFFEGYMYWLLNAGATDEFKSWIKENEQKYSDFKEWFYKHPMVFGNDNITNRYSYD